MDETSILAYTEAYRVYQLLDEDAKSKIPQKVVEFLEKNKNLDYGEALTPAIPLEMQKISKEGWNVITYLTTFFK